MVIRVAVLETDSLFEVNLDTGEVTQLDFKGYLVVGKPDVERSNVIIDMCASSWGGVWAGDDVVLRDDIVVAVSDDSGSHYYRSSEEEAGFTLMADINDLGLQRACFQAIREWNTVKAFLYYTFQGNVLTCEIKNSAHKALAL